ncbi:hypothetical protein LJC56_10610, partial [Christensenellaceae bacterium OttesenSCG-928-K19]|nr:hypothetical protein [Christensenellaceae bacterium OttesenSCG-928-K19]
MTLTPLQLKITRRYLSRMGFALAAMMVLSIGMQFFFHILFTFLLPSITDENWYIWLLTILCNYTL